MNVYILYLILTEKNVLENNNISLPSSLWLMLNHNLKNEQVLELVFVENIFKFRNNFKNVFVYYCGK